MKKTIISGKGGNGKTTSSTNLASFLAVCACPHAGRPAPWYIQHFLGAVVIISLFFLKSLFPHLLISPSTHLPIILFLQLNTQNFFHASVPIVILIMG
ncbi:hypothetical protein J7L48_08030 [bacterium]|nr:hypothetical protein [bacterium]